MARFDLTASEWAAIEAVLPTDVRGTERADDRRVLNRLFWRLRTGAPWADIPARYGPAHDMQQPLPALAQAGVWDRLLKAVSEATKAICR